MAGFEGRIPVEGVVRPDGAVVTGVPLASVKEARLPEALDQADRGETSSADGCLPDPSPTRKLVGPRLRATARAAAGIRI